MPASARRRGPAGLLVDALLTAGVGVSAALPAWTTPIGTGDAPPGRAMFRAVLVVVGALIGAGIGHDAGTASGISAFAIS